MLYNFRDDITNITFWKLYDEAKEQCVNIVLTSSKKWAIELLRQKAEEILRSYNIPERSLSELVLYAAISWASYEEIKEAFERVYWCELEEEAEANLIDGEDYQDLFARVASYYADNQEHANRIYDYISKLWFMPATPILSNGGTDRGLPISCFLNEKYADLCEKTTPFFASSFQKDGQSHGFVLEFFR